MTTFVIRMAFAALEAMEELDLFGIHGGGPSSKIHVMLDEAQKVCFVFRDTKAKSMLRFNEKNMFCFECKMSSFYLYCSAERFCNPCFQGSLFQRYNFDQ